MKRVLWMLAFGCGIMAARAQQKPRLVVGIVIDQMRYDYLTKFYHQYSKGGFRRLMDSGFQMASHHYNYIPTATAPGHTSIYTGTTPAVHGIISNEWYDKQRKQMHYCAADSSVLPVGTASKAAQRSPAAMLTTGIFDQWRFHTAFKAKTIGIAIKDRAAIFPAGHRATGAYWLDTETAGFVTSSYYTPQLPYWVQRFNNRHLPDAYLQGNWNLLLPEAAYPEADTSAFEKGYPQTVFPYALQQLKQQYGPGVITRVPAGNNLTVDFAIAAIEGEQLGKHEVADMLSVSFSTPDIMGHQFGPHSREMHDVYLRLDLELQRLFNYLDKEIGMQQVLVFLTADHGGSDVPGVVKSNTGYDTMDKLAERLNAALSQQLGVDSLIENVSNQQVFFAHARLRQHHITAQQVADICRVELMAYENVYDVLPATALGSCSWPLPLCTLARNSWHAKRSGDLLMITQPGWIGQGYANGGAGHGSAFFQDTHVPMLWMGWKVPSGLSYTPTEVNDIAPTLAALLGCIAPNGTTGMPMSEMLNAVFAVPAAQQLPGKHRLIK